MQKDRADSSTMAAALIAHSDLDSATLPQELGRPRPAVIKVAGLLTRSPFFLIAIEILILRQKPSYPTRSLHFLEQLESSRGVEARSESAASLSPLRFHILIVGAGLGGTALRKRSPKRRQLNVYRSRN